MNRTFVAALILALGACSSAPDGMTTTMDAWSQDRYPLATSADGRSQNAARILDIPDRATDRVMQVGSATALIHERPDVKSRATGRLAAGDAVRVVVESRYLRRPPETAMGEYAAESELTPTWCRVETPGGLTGWVSARALVDPIALAGAPEALARECLGPVEGSQGPRAGSAGCAAADAVIARASDPVIAVRSAKPFDRQPRASAIARLPGSTLERVSPNLAKAAAKAARNALDFSTREDPSGAGSLLGAFGLQSSQEAARMRLALGIIERATDARPPTVVEERFVGRECLALALSDARMLPPDHPLANYVSWVGVRLAGASSLPEPALGMEFVVVDAPNSRHATAIPGGIVIVPTGLLASLESEHELAVMLAREVSRIEERRMWDSFDYRMLRSGFAVMKSLEAQGADSPIMQSSIPAGLPPEVAVQLRRSLSEFPRDQFIEANAEWWEEVLAQVREPDSDPSLAVAADLRGVSLTCAAGWDPRALLTVIRRTGSPGDASAGTQGVECRCEYVGDALPLLPCVNGTAAHGTADAPSAGAVDRWQRLRTHLAAIPPSLPLGPRPNSR